MSELLQNNIFASGTGCGANMMTARKTSSSARMPVAYKSGMQDFYGRYFVVSTDVLIPRPETEQIIDMVLNMAGRAYLPGVKAGRRILSEQPVIYDIGTGSGCIAITIKKELPEADVFATDISNAALEIAQKNAKIHGTPLTFIISHLLDFVNSGDVPRPEVIIANLPYVDENWDWLDKKSLSYEPAGALYAGDGGLELIKELILQAKENRAPHLILESDPCQHAQIADFAKAAGYTLEETRGFAQLYKLS